MALVLGLDLGTRTIKGAVFAGTPRSFRLVDFFVEEIPLLQDTEVSLGSVADGKGMEAILSPEEILHRVLEKRGLLRADIYAAIDAKDCGIRDIPFPYTREDQIQKTVAFEAEHYFHAFDINDVTLEWVKVGESEGTSHLVLVAARNADIEARLDLLKRAEVDPVILDLDSAALANAYTLSSNYDETRNTLLVDMGATSTKIVLLQKGALKKIRSLRTGTAVLDSSRMIPGPSEEGHAEHSGDPGARDGDSVFEARFLEFENAVNDLGEDEGLSRTDPEATDDDLPIAILSDSEYDRVVTDEDQTYETGVAAQSAGDSAEDAEAATTETRPDLETGVAVAEPVDEETAYQSYLGRVAVEIQRTLATTQLDEPIDFICLTGGMSRREEARRFLEESFELETVRLDFRESLETDLDSGQLDLVSSEGAVAVGLAAKGLGKDVAGMDFRKGPFRFEHRFERIRVPLLVCSVICFFVFLQTAFWSFHRYRYLRDHAVAYESLGSSRVYKTFFDKELAPGRSPVVAARDQINKWEAGGLSTVGRFLPFVEVVRDVSTVLASTDLYFRLNSINYKFGLKKSVTGQGRRRQEQWKSAGDSQIVLEVEESNGHLTIEKAFDESPKSRFFEAETQSSPQAGTGDYKVTIKLKVNPEVLAAPASGGPSNRS